MAIISVLLATIATFLVINGQLPPQPIVDPGLVPGGLDPGLITPGLTSPGIIPPLNNAGIGVNQLINGGIGLGNGLGAGLGTGLGLGLGNLGLGGGNAFQNGIAQLIVGTYQWIGQSGDIFTLFVCAGLPGDRFLYASVQRNTINAWGLQNGAGQFSFIVARGILRIGGDGAVATFRGFRIFDAFGIDDDFDMVLVFSRCDNLFQLEIFDETYTLTKISNAQPLQQQCFRPSFVNTFNTFGNVASFASVGNLPWIFPQQFNGPFRSVYTLRRQPFNNAFNVFSCGGFQNPLTNQFLPGRRSFLGNYGPFGHLAWQNALLINAFDDDFDDDFGFGCRRGIEFQFFLDDGDLWCNSRCWNQPTVGWGGRLSPLSNPFNNFGINQCPVPNYGQLNPQFFPGWSPINIGLGGAVPGVVPGLGVGGAGILPVRP